MAKKKSMILRTKIIEDNDKNLMKKTTTRKIKPLKKIGKKRKEKTNSLVMKEVSLKETLLKNLSLNKKNVRDSKQCEKYRKDIIKLEKEINKVKALSDKRIKTILLRKNKEHGIQDTENYILELNECCEGKIIKDKLDSLLKTEETTIDKEVHDFLKFNLQETIREFEICCENVMWSRVNCQDYISNLFYGTKPTYTAHDYNEYKEDRLQEFQSDIEYAEFKIKINEINETSIKPSIKEFINSLKD